MEIWRFIDMDIKDLEIWQFKIWRLGDIYIFIYFESECVYNFFTVEERNLKIYKNYYIETSAHKIRLKTKIFHHKNHKIKIQYK